MTFTHIAPVDRTATHRLRLRRWLLGATMLGGFVPVAALAQAAPVLPDGGTVAAGAASIHAGGATMTVSQASDRAVIDWAGFSIGEGAAVRFENGAGATLNRVTGTAISQIDGRLSASGSLYLVNGNGIVIGKSGVVETGGTFVASTLDIANADFIKGGPLTFAGTSRASVVNLGKVGALGGNVALIGYSVTNSGSLAAANGTAGLLAGSTVLLRDSANDAGGLFSVLVGDNGSSAANGGLIEAASAELRAQQGNVYALAGNTAGTINAAGVRADQGKVWLVSEGGTTTVAGTISARGAGGGAGFVETSGARLDIGAAGVDSHGGEWLLDPGDATIDLTAATTINNSLIGGNVKITTDASTPGTGNGDIIVNAALSWTSNYQLTLSAWRNIVINTSIRSTAGKLELDYGQGTGVNASATSYTLGAGARIYLPAGYNFVTSQGFLRTTWKVITALGAENSASGNDLQGIKGDLSGSYVLGDDIDATPTQNWNVIYGFDPIGSASQSFGGMLDGLGHTISTLNIYQPNKSGVGLFGYIGTSGIVRNLNLSGVDITGASEVGGLAGESIGTISNVNVDGKIIAGLSAGQGSNAGGLVGWASAGSISDSSSSATVTSKGYYIGGLVGSVGSQSNTATITRSFATGSVTGVYGINSPNAPFGSYVGGLVGWNSDSSQISDSFATGDVIGLVVVGGLVGGNSGPISNSYSTSAVRATAERAGGLVGFMSTNGTITSSFATGKVTGSSSTGGLLGGYAGAKSAPVTNSYWDTVTTGQPTSASGGTGLDTAGLAGKLAGFDASIWSSNGGRSTPFLLNISYAPTISGRVILASDSSATPTYFDVLTGIGQVQSIWLNLGGKFVLGNDIDAGITANWDGGKGFVPIGNAAVGFYGVLEGLDHTITGLTIHRPTEDYVGLFGRLGSYQTGAIVRSISLANVDIIGQGTVGALAGFVTANSNISYSAVAGNVTGNSYAVGGLVGSLTNGIVTDSFSAASVSDHGNQVSQIGGLAGLVGANGSIILSYATGDVSGAQSTSIGGLAGLVNGAIYQSFATGAVSGASGIGGLAGQAAGGVITSSYATGAVTATETGTAGSNGIAGGLVGRMVGAASTTGSYAIGSVTGLTAAPLVAVSTGGTITNSYWDSDTTTLTSAYGIGKTTAELAGGLDGFEAWAWSNNNGHSTPFLTNIVNGPISGRVILTMDPAPATPALYYVLTDIGQVQGINGSMLGDAGTMLGAKYVLGNDITASGTSSWNGGAGFLPIGVTAQGADLTPGGGFYGVFDGLGHRIDGLTINSANSRVGLFGLTGNALGAGNIRNLVLVLGGVSGVGEVGGLVGEADGTTISNVTVHGNVTGTAGSVGGLAGMVVGGSVTGSHAIANVTGSGTVVDTSTKLGGEGVGGLVGSLKGGTISNSLAFAPWEVKGLGGETGGLVGFVDTGTITQSSASGIVTGQGDGVGGLVGGLVGGTITASFSSATVTGYGQAIGGLVGGGDSSSGNTPATISRSYATGSVFGLAKTDVVKSGWYVGGLVGAGAAALTVRESFASGDVSGVNYVGGLIGGSQGTIADTFATGAVSTRNYGGGLVGVLGGGSVSRSYAIGTVSKVVATQVGASMTVTTGGLIGFRAGATVTDSYWDSDTTGQTGSAGGTAITTANLARLPANFSTDVWSTANGQTTPFLLNLKATPISGDVILAADPSVHTPTHYSVLTTIEQVQAINDNLTARYVLGNEIDASATAGWNGGMGFSPLNDDSNDGYQGQFNGLGYTIDGLTINLPNHDNVGLFGILTGTVTGLTLTHVNIQGGSNTGGLVGMNQGGITASNVEGIVQGEDFVGGLVGYSEGPITGAGTAGAVTGKSNVGGLAGYSGGDITRSGSSAIITGNSRVGGLVGSNAGNIALGFAMGRVNGSPGSTYVGGLVGLNQANGAISQSFAIGEVIGDSYVGGLVGANIASAAIANSYATGSVTGSSAVGGLVGINAATIDRSYSTGRVTGSSDLGGLVGFNGDGSSVTRSFWDKTGSALESSAGGTGLAAADMLSATSFANAEWSIDTNGGGTGLWRIYEGSTAPLLKAFMTEATVSAGTQETTYSGVDQAGSLSYSAVITSGPATGLAADKGRIHGTATVTCGTGGACKDANTYDLTLAGGLYSDQFGYDLVTSAEKGSLTIKQADLALIGSRTYDGTTAIAGQYLTANGVNGESFFVTDNGTSGTLTGSAASSSGYALTDLGGLSLGAVKSGNALAKNYKPLSVDGSKVTIDKATLAIAGKTGTVTYNGSEQVNGYAVTGTLFASDKVTGVTGLAHGTNASDTAYADAALTAQGIGLDNYAITYTNGSLKIDRAALAIAGKTGTVTYNGGEQANDYIVTGTLFANDKVTGVTGLAKATNASDTAYADAALAAQGDGLANYDITYTNGSLKIDRAALAIAGKTSTVTYNGKEQANDYTVTGTLFASDKVTGVTGLAHGTSASDTAYADTALTAQGIGLDNYDITYTKGSLTIGRAALAIAGKTGTVTYNSSEQTNGYDVTGTLFANDKITGVTGLAQGIYARNTAYADTALTAQGIGLDNYDITYTKGSLTIGKATLTITGKTNSLTYTGSEQANFGATLDGVQVNDAFDIVGYAKATSVTGKEAPDTLAVIDRPQSTAQVGIASAGSMLDNYIVVVHNGGLTIKPAPLTITGTTVTDAVYNGKTQTHGYMVDGLLVAGDTVTGVSGLASGIDASTTPYADALAKAVGTGLENYDIHYVNGSLAIGKATLTLTGGNHTVTYNAGEQLNSGASYAGQQGSDSFTIGGYAKATNASDTAYADALVVSAVGATKLSNYDVKVAKQGKLTIGQATLTLTGSDHTLTYNGGAQSNSGASYSGQKGTDSFTVTGYAKATDASDTAYVDTLGVAGVGSTLVSNYKVVVEKQGTLTIGKATLTLTGADNTVTYNGAAQSNSGASYSGQKGTDSFTITGYATGTNAGTAAYVDALGVTGIGATKVSNYTVAVAKQGKLTINPAALTVTYTATPASR
ncbi:MAG: filamentous hemagglutinin N-terminal domain-containing protein, partial [Sphingomonadales bacterium]|nr:filamentous hemagglutinin N-terminal domain-containing protein [Sphingomonadales bacterium]